MELSVSVGYDDGEIDIGFELGVWVEGAFVEMDRKQALILTDGSIDYE